MTPRARLCTSSSLITLALLALPPAWAQQHKPARKAAPAATKAAPEPAATPQAPTPAPTPAAPAQAPATQQADYIVAVVNSEPITNNDVRERTARVIEQLTAQNTAIPPRGQLMQDVLERLIAERIQVQLALEAGIKADDYAIDQAEQSVAQQNNVSLDELHRQLARDGITVERFRRELRSQLLTLRIRERDVESRVKVSDADVDQFMQQQQQNAGAAPQAVYLGHILIEVPENAAPEQVKEREARAREVMSKLQAGGDFAALAREYSDAPEGQRGGVIGLRPADRYPSCSSTAPKRPPWAAWSARCARPRDFTSSRCWSDHRAACPPWPSRPMRATSCCAPGPSSARPRPRPSSRSCASASNAGRRLSSSSRANFRTTPVPSRAGTSAGPFPAATCRSSSRRSTSSSPARSASPWSRVSACT